LLVLSGGKFERLLDELVQDVEDVEADELWACIGMKERTKTNQGRHDASLGDWYTYLGMEPLLEAHRHAPQRSPNLERHRGLHLQARQGDGRSLPALD